MVTNLSGAAGVKRSAHLAGLSDAVMLRRIVWVGASYQNQGEDQNQMYGPDTQKYPNDWLAFAESELMPLFVNQ